MFKEITDQLGKHFSFIDVKTSGWVFKLLTRFTVNILICFAVLISLKQVFGEPIKCHSSEKDLKEIFEIKCWLEGVYIDQTLLNGTVGSDITRWGVGSPKIYQRRNYINQNYYQWVVPVLLLQALLLYLPWAFWNFFEEKLMEKLVNKTDSYVVTDEWEKEKGCKDMIIRYMKEVPGKYHRRYFCKYFVCEALAVGALIFDMFLMQWVFNDFWTEYRPAISAMMQGNYTAFSQNSAKLFPTQAKCIYNFVGASGSMNERDAICFLPQNTVNEKVFLFLYLWLIALIILSFLNMTYLVAMMSMKCLRTIKLHQMSGIYPSDDVQKQNISCLSKLGYWFTIYMLHSNLNPVLFRDLVQDLIKPPAKPKSPKTAAGDAGETSVNIDDQPGSPRKPPCATCAEFVGARSRSPPYAFVYRGSSSKKDQERKLEEPIMC